MKNTKEKQWEESKNTKQKKKEEMPKENGTWIITGETKKNLKEKEEKGIEKIKRKTEMFLQKLKDEGWWDDEYCDYSKVEYVDHKTYVKIINKEFNTEHLIMPENVLNGNFNFLIRNSVDKNIFFKKIASKIHNNKYIYPDEYKNYKTKIDINCPEHGIFKQSPHDHLTGHGCFKCGKKILSEKFSSNKKEFIKSASKTHNIGRYNYLKFIYKNSKTKGIIGCNECGHIFEQTPSNHLRGAGCPKCGGTIKSNKKEFIKKSESVHGKGRYNYSKFEYENAHVKSIITCNVCNHTFKKSPNKHLQGQGCPKCSLKTRSIKRSLNKEEFIRISEKVHETGRYDYSNFDYKGIHTKGEIKCNECEYIFEQSPNNHSRGNGCPKCSGLYKPTTEEVIERFEEVHEVGRYDYSDFKYKNMNNKGYIKCNVCNNKFLQYPTHHLEGKGCPKCNESKGEKEISKILDNLNITYKSQKTFKDCKNVSPLRFDFFIPEYNLLIEYNGIQHYKPVEYWGGEETFKSRLKNDKIKENYCKNNNINLLIIPYTEFNNIEKIIKNKIKELNYESILG